MKIALIGFDVELSGKHVICVGLSTLKSNGEHTSELFTMNGLEAPVDIDGINQLMNTTNRPIEDYGSFTKDKWDWWSNHLSCLRPQILNPPVSDTNRGVWRKIRERFDELCLLFQLEGYRVRVVSDNASVDCGVINEHIKQAYDGDWSMTVDHIKQLDGKRKHSFIVDSRTPMVLRVTKVLHYKPIRIPHVRFIKHYAPHDAWRSLCEYMGYILTYPMVEW
jgi:hypothetical protein